MSAPARATRDALLDAAYDAVVAGDWAQTRMADVARTAGVSRQTLYNEFGTKDGLAQALTLREAERFIDGTEASLDSAHVHGPAAAVAAAVAYTLREAAENPLLKASLTDDAAGLLPFLTTRSAPVVRSARESIRDYLHGRWPDLPHADVDAVAETVVRLTVSYIVLPSDQHDASADAVAGRIGHLVARLLDPYTRRTTA